MKKEIYIDLARSFFDSLMVQDDNFFPNEIVEKVNENMPYNSINSHRILSPEEKKVITPEAFQLLLFWVHTREIKVDFLEKFMFILVSLIDKINLPLDASTLPSLLEVISVVDYKEHAIYTALEIYIDSPDLLKNKFNRIH